MRDEKITPPPPSAERYGRRVIGADEGVSIHDQRPIRPSPPPPTFVRTDGHGNPTTDGRYFTPALPPPAPSAERMSEEEFERLADDLLKSVKCSIFGWPDGEVEKALANGIAVRNEARRARAEAKENADGWGNALKAYNALRAESAALAERVRVLEAALEEAREWITMIDGWKPRDMDATIAAIEQIDKKLALALGGKEAL